MDEALKIKDGFSVVSHNLRRSPKVLDELKSSPATRTCNILLLQEPPVRRNRMIGLRSGWQFACGAKDNERPMTAIISMDRQCDILLMSHLSSPFVTTVCVTTQSASWYLVSIYCPPNSAMQPILETLGKVVHEAKRRVILAGDVNAWSELWGSSTTNLRGLTLNQFLLRSGIALVTREDSPPSFRNHIGESNIDVVMATPDIAHLIDQPSVRFLTSSDHAVIKFNVQTRRTSEGNNSSRFNTSRANWNAFNSLTTLEEVEPMLQRIPASETSLELAAVTANDCITKAASLTIPRKTQIRKRVPWWSPEIEAARKASNKARKNFQKCSQPTLRTTLRQIYQIVRKAYNKKVSAAKKKSWRNFVSEEGKKGPWGIPYKVAKGEIYANPADTAIPAQGIYPMTRMDSNKNLINALFPVDNSAEDSDDQKFVRKRCRVPPGTPLMDAWDGVDLAIAVDSQNQRGAPGPDLITAPMIKNINEEGNIRLLALFNACLDAGYFPKVWKQALVRTFLKKGPRNVADPKSYRPISLLPVLGKTLESMVKVKLSPVVDTKCNIHQYGSTKGRCAADAIKRVKKIVEESQAAYVIVVFFDIAGAFDSAWWPAILQTLQRWEIPSNMFALVSSFLEDRIAIMASGNAEVKIEVTQGCPQGSVLGPLLWKVVFDGLINTVEAGGFQATAYVDDLAVAVQGQSRVEVLRKCEAMIETVQKWCTGVKMRVNESKTVGAVAKGHFDHRHPPRVKIGEKWLSFPEEISYLGVTFSQNLGFAPHIKSLGGKAVKVMNIMARLCSDTWGLKFKMTRQIYESCFLGTVLYASEVWGRYIHKGQLKTIERLQRQALVRLTQAYRTTSTDALQVLAGTPPIELLIAARITRMSIKEGALPPLRLHQKFRDVASELLDAGSPDKEQVQVVLNDAVTISWEERWQTTTNAAITKEFFPTISSRVSRNFIELDHWVVQILSGHGNFNAKLFYFKRKPNPLCECGSVEDAVHVLTACSLYDHARFKLMRTINSYSINPLLMVSSEANFAAFVEFVHKWKEIKKGY